MNTSEIQSLLAEYDIEPNKVLGQNFLVHEWVLNEIITAANISSDDTVVEVGGGVGIVTQALAKKAARVITVEKDRNLIPILKKLAEKYPNIEVVEGDILKFDPKNYKLRPAAYKLVGNPPYYLTGRLFRTFLEDPEKRPSSITVVIQKEVAKKMLQKPPRMNLLALSVQVFGNPHIVRAIPKSAFWPQPSVQSTLIVVDVYDKPPVPENHIEELFRIAKGAFLHTRKQLKNTIPEDQLKKAGIDPQRRPQTLTIEEWGKILTN